MQKPHKTGVTGGPLALQPGQARAQLGSGWVRAGAFTTAVVIRLEPTVSRQAGFRTRVVVVLLGDKGTTFSRDVSDWRADQRSWVRGYDNSLPLLFRFSSSAAFLPEWIRSTVFTLSRKKEEESITIKYSVAPEA